MFGEDAALVEPLVIDVGEPARRRPMPATPPARAAASPGTNEILGLPVTSSGFRLHAAGLGNFFDTLDAASMPRGTKTMQGIHGLPPSEAAKKGIFPMD